MGERSVAKSNELNAMIVHKGIPWGNTEQKIAAAAVSLISPQDDDLTVYTLDAKELAGLIGISEKMLTGKHIKKICESLMDTKFEVSKGDALLITTFMASAEINLKTNSVEFDFSRKLKPHLIDLKKKFTKYYLSQIAALKGKHSVRMYELLRERLSLSLVRKGVTSKIWTVSLQDLRKILLIPDNEYVKFNDFSKSLKRIQKELKVRTDLAFEFRTIGKPVTAIKFTVLKNTVDSEFEPVPENEITGELLPECNDPAMLAQLQAAVPSLAADQAVFLVNNYSREMLMESLLGLLAAIGSGQIKTTPAQYLMGILKNKQQEATDRPPTTTDERLTDRSWADPD